MARLLLALIFLWLLPAAAQARQVALVVGIARYDRLAALENPQRDAAAISDRLRDLGFEVIEAFDADRFALERARSRFIAKARGADLALFYFAGHGVQLFDRNVLIVRDANPEVATTVDQLGLDLNRFMDELRAAGPVRSALLIDACRDNPLGFESTVALLRRIEQAAGAAQGGAGASARGAAATRGLSVVTLPARPAGASVGAGETLTFFAAQPGQVSYDGEGRNSYFVEGLREALSRPGQPLSEQLRKASAYVRTVTKGLQVPQLVSDWTGDVVLGQATANATVRFINTSRAGGSSDLSAEEARVVGEAQRAYPALIGRFIALESQAFTNDFVAADQATREKARAIGSINGFAIDYDIDRDGRNETLGVYVQQVNVLLTVTDEGITLRDTPCWDFGSDQIEAMHLGLRDINGDRRPELFVYYTTKDSAFWGNLCILEYRGDANLARLRRSNPGTDWAKEPLFKVLLRHEGAWTVRIGEDNSIETCAGSNCHTRSAYSFDGTHFRMTLDQSEQPSQAKALPFRDHNERRQILAAAGELKLTPPAEPVREQPAAATTNLASRVSEFVENAYLMGGISGNADAVAYTDRVQYYGASKTRAAVIADKARYYKRWPKRDYRLLPGTLKLQPSEKVAGALDVAFEYEFAVADGSRRVAGRGRTRLTLIESDQKLAIASEEGEVVARK